MSALCNTEEAALEQKEIATDLQIGDNVTSVIEYEETDDEHGDTSSEDGSVVFLGEVSRSAPHDWHADDDVEPGDGEWLNETFLQDPYSSISDDDEITP